MRCALSIVLASVAACGGAPAATDAPPVPPATTTPSAEEAHPGTTEVGGAVPADDETASAPPSPAAAPQPAHTTDAPGVEALTEAEREEVEAGCQRVAEHARAIARADRARSSLRSYLEQVEAKPPTIAGEDVPRCLHLMLRSAVAQEARDAESVAINRLRTMVVGLSGAVAREGALCPSTPPVPIDLASLKGEPVVVEGPAWEAPGWRCLGFDLHQAPQRFQYQLTTDPDAGTYELVARGFPVAGRGAVELVLAGTMENGAVEPHSNVMRRPAR